MLIWLPHFWKVLSRLLISPPKVPSINQGFTTSKNCTVVITLCVKQTSNLWTPSIQQASLVLHNVPTGEPNHKTRSMSKLQEVSQCMPCDFHKLTLLQQHISRFVQVVWSQREKEHICNMKHYNNQMDLIIPCFSRCSYDFTHRNVEMDPGGGYSL